MTDITLQYRCHRYLPTLWERIRVLRRTSETREAMHCIVDSWAHTDRMGNEAGKWRSIQLAFAECRTWNINANFTSIKVANFGLSRYQRLGDFSCIILVVKYSLISYSNFQYLSSANSLAVDIWNDKIYTFEKKNQNCSWVSLLKRILKFSVTLHT